MRKNNKKCNKYKQDEPKYKPPRKIKRRIWGKHNFNISLIIQKILWSSSVYYQVKDLMMGPMHNTNNTGKDEKWPNARSHNPRNL